MSYKNILIIKLSAIGDVIHALPVAYALKKTYPQSRITWIVEKAAYDLLTNNPYIDEIIVFEKPKFKSLSGLYHNVPKLAALLKSRKFDLALDLQGLMKSASIAWLSGAKIRLGYCDMREGSHLISAPVCGEHRQGHVIDRYLDVAKEVGCSIDEVVFPIQITESEVRSADNIALEAGLNTKSSYLVLAPGTNWPTKCWPAEKFATLIDMLPQNIIPVIIGGIPDRRLADEIVRNSDRGAIDLTGKTTLKQLAHLVKHAKVFVGGDTGPMHLAVAVKTPVIALFGPSDPDRNGPYHGINKVITARRPCLRCQKRQCDMECLSTISESEVLQAIEKNYN